MRYCHLLYTLLFGAAVVLFFGLAYPHHLHYQEQYQLFLFDGAYVWEIVRLPGGVADLLGRFCTQFFLYAWVGAAIVGLLLSAVQMLTFRLVFPARDGAGVEMAVGAVPCALSFVPAFLLWLFLLDENALLGGAWALLLTLLAAWAFGRVPTGWLRQALLAVAVPVLYWVAGPVSVVCFLLQSFRERRTLVFVALLALMPVLLASRILVPDGSLWYGIHYHRYPTVTPVLLWGAALAVLLLALVARLAARWCRPSGHPLLQCLGVGLVAFGLGSLVWKNANFRAEKVMKYDFMARYQQWNRIFETINAEKPNNQVGVTVQNLALAMHGQLADRLFYYNQNGLAGLLPDVQRDATSPLPTAEAFYQLGLVYVAQRTVFEAQEAILDYQKSARCYKRLAQTNLIIGSYGVARKYLLALQKTLFYRDWANETLPLLGDEEAIARHPEYGRLRRLAFTDEFLFGDHVTPDLLERFYTSHTDNLLAYQYLLAYYALTGDRDNYERWRRWARKTSG